MSGQPERVHERDLHWVLSCPQCPGGWLSKHQFAPGARAARVEHVDRHPGHQPTYREESP